MRELHIDELEGVIGAGNPFADIPRVPNEKIDQDLRNNLAECSIK